MSNQTHREPEDLVTKRREYVQRQDRINSYTLIGGSCSCLWAGITLVATGGCLMHGDYLGALWYGMAGGALALLFATLCRIGIKDAQTLPNLPPDQIEALAGPGILLRGSDEPAATPGELLRAAQAAAADSAEELLRGVCTLE